MWLYYSEFGKKPVLPLTLSLQYRIYWWAKLGSHHQMFKVPIDFCSHWATEHGNTNTFMWNNKLCWCIEPKQVQTSPSAPASPTDVSIKGPTHLSVNSHRNHSNTHTANRTYRTSILPRSLLNTPLRSSSVKWQAIGIILEWYLEAPGKKANDWITVIKAVIGGEHLREGWYCSLIQLTLTSCRPWFQRRLINRWLASSCLEEQTVYWVWAVILQAEQAALRTIVQSQASPVK